MLAQDEGPILVESAVITPARYDHSNLRYFGAVYGETGLVPQSVRSNMAWRFQDESADVEISERFGSALYVGRLFEHFGHFLIESLPNFIWAAGQETIIAHPWFENLTTDILSLSYIKICLDALAIDPRDVVFAKQAIQVDRLRVVPRNDVIIGRPSLHMRDVFRKVRDHVSSISAPVASEKVYFSRSKFTGLRRSKNEEEIEALFEARGFEIVHPEDMPFEQQVRHAANAKIFAGIDGSALHLCGFMQEGGRCLVIATRPRQAAIGAVNSLVGVETDWIEGLRLPAAHGDAAIAIDIPRLRSEMAARAWL